MSTIRTHFRKAVGAAAVVALAVLSLSACGSDSSSTGRVDPIVSVPDLNGQTTAVALDKGFTDALSSLGLTPGVVGTAKLQDGSLVFPITGGNVSYFKPGTVDPYVIGQIQHEGSGFSLTAGSTTVSITNLNVDPGVSRVYGEVSVNGKVVAPDAYVLTLNGTTLKPLQTHGSTAVLEGTKVSVSPVAADLLDKTFNTDAVTPDLLVGIAKITISTQ